MKNKALKSTNYENVIKFWNFHKDVRKKESSRDYLNNNKQRCQN